MAKIVIRVLAVIVLLVVGGVGGIHIQRAQQTAQGPFMTRVDTTLLNLDVNWIVGETAEHPPFAGGLGLHDRGVVIAEGAERGAVYFLPADGEAILPTGIRLPENNRGRMPTKTPSGRDVHTFLLKYNDLAITSVAGQELLLVSYSHYDPDKACFFNRLASMPLPDGWLDDVLRGSPPGGSEWRVVFETTPCLPILEVPGYTFTGHQAGGRIAVADDGLLYLTVGDYQFDGQGGRVPPHPQLPDSHYGKILRLRPSVGDSPWRAEIVSMGHRNPQGITFDRSGRIWSVEHSAMGGDELNRIVDGTNYGWPVVTLGVDYTEVDSDAKFWPFNQAQGRHEGYVEPVYAWLPSIAPSSVKLIEGLDPRWDGDLLVGSLKFGFLVRVRLADGHVVVTEAVRLQRRVRYAEVAHGRIYVLFDQGELAILTPRKMSEEHADLRELIDASPGDDRPRVAGRSALADFGCLQCHSDPSVPKLSGVFGGDIAAQPAVDYSQALRSKDGTWTESNLRAFLMDTQAFAPGSIMPRQHLSPADIEAVIVALEQRKGGS